MDVEPGNLCFLSNILFTNYNYILQIKVYESYLAKIDTKYIYFLIRTPQAPPMIAIDACKAEPPAFKRHRSVSNALEHIHKRDWA